jgi:flagellin
MRSIATNTNASRAEHAMNEANRRVQEATSQIATGRRINAAADDSAGMSIGSRLTGQSISMQRAMRNANDGISMLQTVDAAAGNLSNALQRMREIAIQSANGTYGDSDRLALTNEFVQLREQLNTTIDSARWNGQKLLDGTVSRINLQIGVTSADGQAVDMADFKSLTALSVAGVGTPGDALSSLASIDASLASVDEARVGWGAAMSRLAHAGDVSSNASVQMNNARSKIIDADYAQATADLAKAQILHMAGKAMLSQANQAPVSVLRLLR